MRKLTDKGKDILGEKSPFKDTFNSGNNPIFNQSLQEPDSKSHNTESGKKNQITPDEPHSKSPSLNSDLSINDKNENVKILKLFLVFWFISKNEKYTKNSYCSHC